MERRASRDLTTTPGLAPWSALARGFVRHAAEEWQSTGLYRLSLDNPAPKALAAAPRDYRPSDPDIGRAILAGRFTLAGATLDVGPDGDPWDRTSPSRLYAVQLHRFAWLPDLLATGDAGSRAALRLFLDWRRLFGRVSPFAWGADVLERRVYGLACAGRRIGAVASEAETALFAGLLAAQARHLGRVKDASPARAAERATAMAVAGTALAGPIGEQILSRALTALNKALKDVVLPDGGLKTRSPEGALELALDLLTLDDALLQRGREAPPEVSRALDRLTGAVRFFTLGDGRLACFHGGEGSDPARVEAARLHHDEG